MKKARQIRFRIWDRENKKFASVAAVSLLRFGEADSPNRFYETWDERFLLLQDTGVLDFKKRPVYEGDILKLNAGQPYESTYEVVWGEGGFFLISAERNGDDFGVYTKDLAMACTGTHKGIVIGNIFEKNEDEIGRKKSRKL